MSAIAADVGASTASVAGVLLATALLGFFALNYPFGLIFLGDAGAYASLSTKVLTRATTHATGPYVVPHAKIDCYVMYTNNPPSGAFRGFGVTQSAFAVEQNMDLVAEAIGMTVV